MSDFANKVVMISGAAGGVGRAAAHAFAEAGARLVLTDLDAAATAELAATLEKAGAEVAFTHGDMADESTAEAWAALAVERFGGIDAALNNAGMEQPMMRVQSVPSDLARRVMDVDALGVFYAMKRQLPVMTRQFKETGRRAAVLNVASIAGVVAAPQLAVYAAAKHAVVGLSVSAALEVARAGVRVNALCPAFFRTRMVIESLDRAPVGREAAEAALVATNPMRRLGEVTELTPAMLWALSPRNSFFTGQTLRIDGGLSA